MEGLWTQFDRIVVFDTETTGIEFGRDRIIELGAVSLENGVERESMDLLVRLPVGQTLPPFITDLTGITDRQLAAEGVDQAEAVSRFCGLLDQSRRAKLFTTGEGFSNIVGAYIAQRLSICGFMVFNNVHFYDYMLFRDAHHLSDAAEAPPVMFAVSQSGETEPVLNDVRHARQNGHKIVTLTMRSDSTLAQMSDIVFVVDGSRQTLAGSLPNSFFGHVILAFEELVAFYFGRERDA